MKGFSVTALSGMVLGLTLASCDFVLHRYHGSDNDVAGIVLDESIAGIELEMDSAEVRDVLGAPDEIIAGDFPGVIYSYTRKPEAGIEVEFSGDTTFARGVVSICATEPYEGTTESGLGLGSMLKEVDVEIGEFAYLGPGRWIPSTPGVPVEIERTAQWYYNLPLSVTSFHSRHVAPSEVFPMIDTLRVAKICMVPLPNEPEWVNSDAAKFFPSEQGILAFDLLGSGGCPYLLGHSWTFRIGCVWVEDNHIPEDLSAEGTPLIISGRTVAFPVGTLSATVLKINTIRPLEP